MRPGYPKELYQDLFAYKPVEAGSRAVEVGIGTGQATRPVLETGCQVTAVEYAVYMPGTRNDKIYGEEEARERAEAAARYGFVDIQYKLYHRVRTFTAAEYVQLVGTYSDHVALEEEKRKRFFAEICQVIERLGGEISIYDTLDLQLARKP